MIVVKIGLNLLCLSGHITDAELPQIEHAKTAGFDGVEIPIFDGDDAHYLALGQKIADLGLECTASTALPDGEHAAGLLSDNATTRVFASDRMKSIINSTAALGASLVCGPMAAAVGYFTGSSRTPEEWDRAVAAHKLLAQYASDAGVILSFEPLNRFETYFANTMEDGAALAFAVNHPSFRILYDTFHANIEAKDPVAAYDLVREHIGNVHIAENDRGIPGQGHIDFANLFRKLQATNYEGWMTVEAFSQSLPELAAATRIWRPLYKDFETLATESYKFVSEGWATANQA
jgi:D-psicose/D-tagatose/L-ribulose 3-epimerase